MDNVERELREPIEWPERTPEPPRWSRAEQREIEEARMENEAELARDYEGLP